MLGSTEEYSASGIAALSLLASASYGQPPKDQPVDVQGSAEVREYYTGDCPPTLTRRGGPTPTRRSVT